MAETLAMGTFTAQLDDSEAEELRKRFTEGGPGFTDLHLPAVLLNRPHKSLAAALAAVQAEIPEVIKAEGVKNKDGTTRYTYADLSAVTRAILPLLGQHGLSWITKPTLINDKFVLEYALQHESGESETGIYPLPTTADPQATGSAITYARRYTLCSMTGVAPGDDDDAAEAQAAYRRGDDKPAAPAKTPMSSFEATAGLSFLAVPTDEQRDAAGWKTMAAAFQQTLDFRACLDEHSAWDERPPNTLDATTWSDLYHTRVTAEIKAATLPATWKALRQTLNEAGLGGSYAEQLKAQADRIIEQQTELTNTLTSLVLSSKELSTLTDAWHRAVDRKRNGEITEEQLTHIRGVVDERQAKLEREQHKAAG